jgi:hypothetical protein
MPFPYQFPRMAYAVFPFPSGLAMNHYSNRVMVIQWKTTAFQDLFRNVLYAELPWTRGRQNTMDPMVCRVTPAKAVQLFLLHAPFRTCHFEAILQDDLLIQKTTSFLSPPQQIAWPMQRKLCITPAMLRISRSSLFLLPFPLLCKR